VLKFASKEWNPEYSFAGNDPCKPNPCHHSGTCLQAHTSRGYHCLCQPGWRGYICDRKQLCTELEIDGGIKERRSLKRNRTIKHLTSSSFSSWLCKCKKIKSLESKNLVIKTAVVFMTPYKCRVRRLWTRHQLWVELSGSLLSSERSCHGCSALYQHSRQRPTFHFVVYPLTRGLCPHMFPYDFSFAKMTPIGLRKQVSSTIELAHWPIEIIEKPVKEFRIHLTARTEGKESPGHETRAVRSYFIWPVEREGRPRPILKRMARD